ncbi:MAG: hypothetical protein H6680_01850 [Desulfobacteraceae bacterium]|nr:hypothetical protein [Desulfobacteraceae bacterium]
MDKGKKEHLTKMTKDIVISLCRESQNFTDDGTGYVNSVKAVLEGMKSYLEKQGEGLEYQNIYEKIYTFSKKIWIKEITENRLKESDRSLIEKEALYYDYCFEHIYKKGDFPL